MDERVVQVKKNLENETLKIETAEPKQDIDDVFNRFFDKIGQSVGLKIQEAGYGLPGQYFGFTNADGDKFFGDNWSGKTFTIYKNSNFLKPIKIKVWKNDKHCKSDSCGRVDPYAKSGKDQWAASDILVFQKQDRRI